MYNTDCWVEVSKCWWVTNKISNLQIINFLLYKWWKLLNMITMDGIVKIHLGSLARLNMVLRTCLWRAVLKCKKSNGAAAAKILISNLQESSVRLQLQKEDPYFSILMPLHTSDIWSLYVWSAKQQIGRMPITVLHTVKWICLLFKQHCYKTNTESSSCGHCVLSGWRFWNE